MKSTSKLLFIILFAASVGSAQVVLPSGSDYNDPYNYFRDCVSANGNEAEDVCERQTSSLFPEGETAQEPVRSNDDDLAAYSQSE